MDRYANLLSASLSKIVLFDETARPILDNSNHSNAKMELTQDIYHKEQSSHYDDRSKFSVCFLGDYFNNPFLVRSLPTIADKAPIELDNNYNPVMILSLKLLSECIGYLENRFFFRTVEDSAKDNRSKVSYQRGKE